LASAKLDGLGLTSTRVHALKSIAGAIVRGELDFAEPGEIVLAKLAELPGIGEWTAQYIALRGLNEPDALPSGDLVLRRVVGSGGEPLSLIGVQEHAESWRPWRSYAVMYLWCFPVSK
jgi:AraC family transcriptional regulator of adaptative response / DNA-3-methyladenine glycosylase II